MLSLSSLIEFLLDMLRDEATQAEFARDPSGTLAARGLADVTAEDIRDVQPMLEDVGGVHRVVHDPAEHHSPVTHALHGGGAHAASGSHDVVREIHHVTRELTVARPEVTQVTHEYKTYNSFTEFSTDNSVHAEDGSTVIQDSFNQDNDGVDNKGGTITDGTVSGGNMGQSGTVTETTTVEGSGNDSQTVVEAGSGNDGVDNKGGTITDGTVSGGNMGQSGNQTDTTTVDGSGNDTQTVVETGPDGTVVVHDPADAGGDEEEAPVSGSDESDEGGDDGGDAPTITYDEPHSGSFGDGTVNDSYAVDAPAASVGSDDAALVGAEHS